MQMAISQRVIVIAARDQKRLTLHRYVLPSLPCLLKV